MNYHIICVGAGGTGGNFLTGLGRFLLYFNEEGASWSLDIIDGDIVEARNAERQPFMATDVMQHKSSVMAEGLVDCLGLPPDRVTAYTQYIDDYDQLKSIIHCHNYCDSVVILVGCVDNHRARQVMHEAFCKTRNIVYIDSANEYEEGEIVCGIRIEGKEIAPPRAYYFEEILKDKGKRASEQSCGVINKSSPQHLVTNLTAAHYVLSFVVKCMSHRAEGGIVHFNPFTFFTRYDRWTPEMQAAKEAKEKEAAKAKKKKSSKSKACNGEKVNKGGK